MKRSLKNYILSLLSILIIIPIYYTVGSKDFFPYVFSYTLYQIFISLFYHVKMSNLFSKHFQNSQIYSLKKTYFCSNIILITINIVLSLCTILLGFMFENLFSINNILLILFITSLTVFVIPSLNLLADLLNSCQHKKLSSEILNYYKIINIILIIISSLICKILNLNSYIYMVLLSLSCLLSYLIILLTIYFFKLKNIFLSSKIPKRNEIKTNYYKEIRKVFSENVHFSLIKIGSNIYLYFSIVFIYCTLMYKYLYDYNEISQIITKTYFYIYGICQIIPLNISFIFNNKFDNIFINLKTKQLKDFSLNFTNITISLLKFLIPLSITIGFLSGPICTIIFSNYNLSQTLVIVIYLYLFLIIYNYLNQIIINLNNKKILYISLTIGLIFKLVFTIPLISAFYRMQSNLIYADIISTIISLILTILINLIYLIIKFQINPKTLFEELIKIIYRSVFLTITLIVIELIFSLQKTTKINSLLTIAIYLFVELLYYLILRFISQKKK